MSATSSTGSGAGGRVRRCGLALVMVGALSVSVRGQVEAVEPLLGGMSVVLALTNDLAALLALHELMSTGRRDVRRWAWAVLVLAGGTAAGLNTWHALEAGKLPPLWAVVVGIGPVLLAVMLSHLVALVLNDVEQQQPAAEAGASTVPSATPPTSAAPATATAAVVPPAVEPPAAPAPAVESSRSAQAHGAALSGPGAHHGLAVVPTPRPLPATHAAAARTSAPARPREGQGTDPRVERLAVQLRAGADLTGASVAEQLGCSARTGRRLLRQAEERVSVDVGVDDPGAGARDGMSSSDQAAAGRRDGPGREQRFRPGPVRETPAGRRPAAVR
jgi:hypothetical protein